jgi:hypothetical protein
MRAFWLFTLLGLTELALTTAVEAQAPPVMVITDVTVVQVEDGSRATGQAALTRRVMVAA